MNKDLKHEAVESLKDLAAHDARCCFGQDGVRNCWCPAETNIRIFMETLEDDPAENEVTQKLVAFIDSMWGRS